VVALLCCQQGSCLGGGKKREGGWVFWFFVVSGGPGACCSHWGGRGELSHNKPPRPPPLNWGGKVQAKRLYLELKKVEKLSLTTAVRWGGGGFENGYWVRAGPPKEKTRGWSQFKGVLGKLKDKKKKETPPGNG